MSEAEVVQPLIEIEYEKVLGWYNVIKHFARGDFTKAISSATNLFLDFHLFESQSENPSFLFQVSHILFDEYQNPRPSIYRVHRIFSSLGLKGYRPWRRTDILRAALECERKAIERLFDGLITLKDMIEEFYGDDIGNLAPLGFVDDLATQDSGFAEAPTGYPPEVIKACLIITKAIISGYRGDIPPLLKIALNIHFYLSLAKRSKLNADKYIWMFRYLKAVFEQMYKEFNEVIHPQFQRIRDTSIESSIQYRMSPLWLTVQNRDKVLPVPFFRIPRSLWINGRIPHKGIVSLEPERSFQLFPRGNEALLSAIYAITGGGKTVLINSLAMARLDRGGFGLRAEIDLDERLQTHLMALPLHNKHPAYEWLVDMEKLRPRGLIVKHPNMKPEDVEKELRDPNLISLVIVTKNTDLDNISTPPLKFDRVIYVEDPSAFKIDFSILAKKGRLVTIRFVEHHITRKAFRSVIRSFLDWRKRNKKIPAFFQIDEGMIGASAMPSMIYGGSSVRSAEEVAVLSRGARGLGLAVDINTQRPSWLVVGARSQMTNIFTGYVGEKKDLDAVLVRIPYGVDKPTIESILQHPEISQDSLYKWFMWFDYTRGRVEMVRPVLPPCGAEISVMDREEFFKPYGLLAESWDEVPVLVDNNGYGSEDTPLPVHEPYMTEKERERYLKKKEKREKSRPDEDVGYDIPDIEELYF